MPETNNKSKDTPGLNSMAYKAEDKPVSTKPSIDNKNSKPKDVELAKPLVENTKEAAKKLPVKYTSSSFKVGDRKYYVVDDNTNTRNLIKWDDKGNVAPDSPVQVIGKNLSGGFVLAADESTPKITKSKFPYSNDKGINFHSLESDQPGATPAMKKHHMRSFSDLSEIANSKAAAKLRGIYKRTGQL